MRFPIPEQYGMIRVPRTVPSMPFAFIDSSRQIMRNDATINRTRNSHGAAARGIKLSIRKIKTTRVKQAKRVRSKYSNKIASAEPVAHEHSRSEWRDSAGPGFTP
jgi:hypothetical protein